MNKTILPRPERLDGTKSCELAALLATLGFEPVDDAMVIARGEGIPGGRLGYWRFLPKHPRGLFDFARVIKHGLDATMARRGFLDDALQPPCKEQAYIAAAFHNKRLMVESVKYGTRLKLERVGYLYVFKRVEAQGVPEMPGASVARGLMAAGTRRTELAAALATLGFEPAPLRQKPAKAATMITHEGGGVTWILPEVSKDGRWNLQERLARWQDDEWCAREDNRDPIACMADAFWNLGHLRNSLAKAQVLVRVQNGNRSVLMPATASDAEWDRASDFLKGRR